MPVEKYRWLPGTFERLGVYQRVQGRRNDFDRLESSRAQIVRHPLRGALDVRLVFALCAHTRYAQKLIQLREMLLLAAVNEFSKVHIGTRRPFPNVIRNLWYECCGEGKF